MGDSHFESNVYAKAGTTPVIRGFATIGASTLTDGTVSISSGTVSGVSSVTDGTLTITGGSVSSGVQAGFSRVKLSDNVIILTGALQTSASILAAATALVTNPKGSLYLSTNGGMWFMDASDSATQMSTI